jgi:hypothetical protein
MDSLRSLPEKRQPPQRLGDRGWWGALLGGIGGIVGTTLGGAIAGLEFAGVGCGLLGVGLVPGAIAGMVVNMTLGLFFRKEIAAWITFLTGASLGTTIAIWFSIGLRGMAA